MVLSLMQYPRAVLAVTQFFYPLSRSWEALHRYKEKDSDVKLWIVYWSILVLWQLAEEHLLWFLIDCVPLYLELEVLFFLWLAHPEFRGALYIWHHCAERYFSAWDVKFYERITSHLGTFPVKPIETAQLASRANEMSTNVAGDAAEKQPAENVPETPEPSPGQKPSQETLLSERRRPVEGASPETTEPERTQLETTPPEIMPYEAPCETPVDVLAAETAEPLTTHTSGIDHEESHTTQYKDVPAFEDTAFSPNFVQRLSNFEKDPEKLRRPSRRSFTKDSQGSGSFESEQNDEPSAFSRQPPAFFCRRPPMRG